MPFHNIIESEPFKKSLEIVLHILKNLQINEYVKLNREVAPEAIDKFGKLYNIEYFEPIINYKLKKAGT